MVMKRRCGPMRNRGSTGEPVWSLVKWDLSGIPATATINDVSITVNVSNTTVAAIDIRDLIIEDYIASYDSQTETYDVKSVFLIGHVPIPMSGYDNPDGHGTRPFPADVFYGEMDSVWQRGTNAHGASSVGAVGDGGIDPRKYLTRASDSDIVQVAVRGTLLAIAI